MQPPFAARINQPVNDQRQEHIEPASPFTTGRQAAGPKLRELQQIPDRQRDPTGSPLPRPLNSKLIQMHRHGGGFFGLQFSFRGQARQSLARSRTRIELLAGLFPTQFLSTGQRSQIEHVSLDHSAISTPPVLDQTPVGVDLSVFASLVGS